MTNVVASKNSIQAIETVLISGDLSKLSPEQRVSYHNKVCETLGLNPLTNPFAYIKLNGKEILYAKRDATDQLRKIHKVSIKLVAREFKNDIYIVTANAKDPDGREDESTGAVTIGGLKGDALANALMKAETKAKRRVTLSICGLGMLDETEVETIPQEQKQKDVTPVGKIDTIDSDASEVAKNLIGEAKSNFDTEYVISFGKYKGKKFKEIPAEALLEYCNYIHEQAPKDKPMSTVVSEFMHRAGEYLDEVHFSKLGDGAKL